MLPKKIVAIGASTCEGVGDAEGGGFCSRLKLWMLESNQNAHVYNLGISGDTSKGMLHRFLAEVTPRKPDLILIQLGCNDFRRNDSSNNPTEISFEDHKDNIRQMLELAQGLAPVLLVSIFPIDESKTTPVSWRPIYYLTSDAERSAAYSKSIAHNMNIPYVDIYNQWKLTPDFKEKFLFMDGLHANNFGHEFIFTKIREKLLELYI